MSSLPWSSNVLPEPVFIHFEKDSEFRVFIVAAEHRKDLVAALKCSTYGVAFGYEETVHHSSVPSHASINHPCVHVPSVGGTWVADEDGEPQRANVGQALESYCPDMCALVVWRRFGGTLLGVSSGGLERAYRVAAQEAASRHAIIKSEAWQSFICSEGEDDHIVIPTNVRDAAAWRVLEPFVLPLPIPCAYYDPDFLDPVAAHRMLAAFCASIHWEEPSVGSLEERATALYGSHEYSNRDGKGYVSTSAIPWQAAPSELLELKNRVEGWLFRFTGMKPDFDVCLLNRYDGGQNQLAWHADREEIDPMQKGPRATPIASVSLGAERLFAFAPKWDESLASRVREAAQALKYNQRPDRAAVSKDLQAIGCPAVQVGHGSLCIMENACQLLYKHALVPESLSEGVRINVTFRAKLAAPVAVKPPAMRRSVTVGEADSVFVGLTPGIDHRKPQGWKDCLIHPFESPFIDEVPAIAAARYQNWLLAQPAFLHFVCSRLAGCLLHHSGSARDKLHARMLAAIICTRGNAFTMAHL